MCIGQPAHVTAVHQDGTADVEIEGREQRVFLALDEPVMAGQWLLVHSGIALLQLSAAEAESQRTLFDTIQEIRP